MRPLLGILRMSIALPTIVIGSLLIIATMWIPIRVRGIKIAAWLLTALASLAMALFNVRFHCAEPEKLFRHQGFVFPNHITYFDILMMVRVLPMRFVSAIENRSMPFIGWVAIAIGTVFVNRSDKQSRAEARTQLAKIANAQPFPPIVVYPEGGVGPVRGLQPFRYGAFEIAAEGGVPYLPCAILYSHPEVIVWGQKEGFMDTFWRLACFPGPVEANLMPLIPIQPGPSDDPKQLATDGHRVIAAALGVPPQM